MVAVNRSFRPGFLRRIGIVSPYHANLDDPFANGARNCTSFQTLLSIKVALTHFFTSAAQWVQAAQNARAHSCVLGREGKKADSMIRLKVNGAECSFDGDPRMPLLWFIRDILGLTGTKFGCGMALCGACTVHREGRAIRSCVVAMEDLRDAQITTIEGVSTGGLHVVQKTWMELNVPQCGYCQSGQIMQKVSLLKDKPRPSEEDIDASMAGNICRCGTYQRIRAAIKAAALAKEAS
jgi:isoquinoline 1-oxidoreductase alpha subunit